MDPRRILRLALATLRLVPPLLLPLALLGGVQGIAIGLTIYEPHSFFFGLLAGLAAAPIVAVLILLVGVHGAAALSACGLWIALYLTAFARPHAASDLTLLVVAVAGAIVCGLVGWRWGDRVERCALPAFSRWLSLHWEYLSTLAALREIGIAAEESVAAIVAQTDLAIAPLLPRLGAALLLTITALDLIVR